MYEDAAVLAPTSADSGGLRDTLSNAWGRFTTARSNAFDDLSKQYNDPAYQRSMATRVFQNIGSRAGQPAQFMSGGGYRPPPNDERPRPPTTINPQAGTTQQQQEDTYQGVPPPNAFGEMNWRTSLPNVVHPQGAIDYMRIVNASHNRGR